MGESYKMLSNIGMHNINTDIESQLKVLMENKYSASIENILGSAAIRIKCKNPKMDAELRKDGKSAIVGMETFMLSFYMAGIPTHYTDNFDSDLTTKKCNKVDDAHTDRLKEYIEMYTKYVSDDFKRINMSKTFSMFKIVSNNSTVYVEVNLSNEYEPIIMSAEYLEDKQICLVRRLRVVDKLYLLRNCHVIMAVAIHKKYQVAERFLKTNMAKLSTITNEYVDMIINALSIAIGNKVDIRRNLVEHSQLEINTICKILNQLSDYNGMDFSIGTLRNYDFPNMQEMSSAMDDKYFKSDTADIMFMKDNVFPVVKFSSREWKFVTNYAYNKGLIYKDTEHLQTIDLIPILKNQRYGRWLRFSYVNPLNNESTELSVSYDFEFDTEHPNCRFYVGCNLSDTRCIYRAIDYWDISKFNLYNSILHSELRIGMNNRLNLPKSYAEATEDVPSCMLDDELIADIMLHVISIYLVIYDRPKRYRVVREESVPDTGKSSQTKSKEKAAKNESNYVISRLIMTVPTAKEYVKSKSSGGSGDRCYVIESWERCGHYRRLPHSEKRIWIKETTCNRHKPIANEKEIVIKL